VVVLVFLLMYFVVQPIVASRQVQEERKVKEVVKAAEEKEIEETAERVKSPGTTLNDPRAIQDGFTNVYSMF